MNKLLFTGLSLRLIPFILPILVWWGYKEVQNRIVHPQAMLVLGGSTRRLEREKFAADFAKAHPDIPIWITGGSPPRYTKLVFTKAGVDPRRLHLDYEAVDTVTNFTTLVDELQARGIKSVYLITSDFHMRRACVIGEIVLGSRGIEFKSISVPSETSPEPIEKAIRDGARAILWVATGYTGAEQSKK
ncbi:YdcF family protein [Anabaena cylindrica UHCC 0172]|uniref:YdcF family protein n=1 Tax=Anabaena cylindrica TaxID=1165 RepID=UPI002B1FC024|nr:YdcF family protein [Anabaena cylindrica]MEA5554110.1 YdcF family protein [Anabaena cylindrica UHCC 0172]